MLQAPAGQPPDVSARLRRACDLAADSWQLGPVGPPRRLSYGSESSESSESSAEAPTGDLELHARPDPSRSQYDATATVPSAPCMALVVLLHVSSNSNSNCTGRLLCRARHNIYADSHLSAACYCHDGPHSRHAALSPRLVQLSAAWPWKHLMAQVWLSLGWVLLVTACRWLKVPPVVEGAE